MTFRPRRGTALVLGLLLALSTGACDGPGDSAGTGPGLPWFEETAAARGLDFRHASGHVEAHLMPEIMGGGAALFDMERDGDLDLYLVQSGSLLEASGLSNRLYANDGHGTFTDVTASSGAGDEGYGMGVASADADGDGDLDLYVTNVGINRLLLNAGAARFRDATEESGTGHAGWGASATFLDANRDGALDLFVTNYLDWSRATELECYDSLSRPDYCSPRNYKSPARDAFFLNRGDGTFADRSRESGVHDAPATGLGIGTGDFDEDGWQDVFVANDGMPDQLWHNLGGERFEDVAMLWGCGVDANGLNKAGMGVALGDLDADLDLDLLVCNLKGESDSLYLNEKGFFADRTARAGLALVSKPFTRFGMALHDFDHDGELDLFQANGRVQRGGTVPGETTDPYAEENLLFRGLGPARFEEVLPRAGISEPLIATSRAAAFGDVNGDGALDIVVVNRDERVHLFENRAEGAHSWVLLQVLESSGSEALGAVVQVRAGERTWRRDVRAGYSYFASNDPRVHVGLGSQARVDEVRVLWVDGERESFGPLEAGRSHALRRGEGRP